ncbi:MAG: hypothetical protein BGO78_10745 [Chloroflexi bacterium 44-23]|nr:MAG: hypothetical protein BGO78_10745 [Chloroflexi bacterium 44-23]
MLGEAIIITIIILAFMVFFYFFVASNEKRQRSQVRKFYSNAQPAEPFQVTQRQPKRLFKKDPQDPLLIFAYWIILPFFSAFVVIIAVLLLTTMF